MSHRRRKADKPPIYRSSPAAKLMSCGAHVVKEQVRWMVFFVGVAFVCQVIFGTAPYPDTIYFAVMGGSFIGLSMPGRLWR